MRFALLALLLAVPPSPAARGDEPAPATRPAATRPSTAVDLAALARDVERVFQRHYPAATCRLDDRTIHVESGAAEMDVNVPASKSGTHTVARKELAPGPGGIVGDFSLERGEYRGQAVVPQALERSFGRIDLDAHYSEAADAHIWSRLKVPKENPPPAAFYAELRKAFVDAGFDGKFGLRRSRYERPKP